MFARSVLGCSKRYVAVRSLHIAPCRRTIGRRRYSSSSHAPPVTVAESKSAAAAFNGMSDELDKLSPRFDIQASQVKIIKTPVDFYETLKTKILNAKRHVFLSTLYVGKTERELIDTLRAALGRNPNLTVSILVDLLRATREPPEEESCATLLGTLVKDFPRRVEVRLYHTPNLTGIKASILPKRINEGWGLQHMKLYGFDDEIMLSGANLSNDYFTNRQDRYHVFSSSEITQYFYRIFRTTCNLSYRLTLSDGEAGAEWPKSNPGPSPLANPKGYIDTATVHLAPLLRPSVQRRPPRKCDTQVYPLLQLTPVLRPDSSTELAGMKILLKALTTPAFAGSSWTFTAGYFNMTPEFRSLLLATQPTRGTVVAASPWANGFYGSAGLSGLLPAAYTYLSRQFLNAVSAAGLDKQVELKEWRLGTVNQPGGWTYHAKGLWITLPKEQSPSISIIGSSNYTKRSYSLDLEANALIVTRNADLKKRLGEEERWLQEHAKTVDDTEFQKTERRVGLHVRIAMWIVTLVGGAL